MTTQAAEAGEAPSAADISALVTDAVLIRKTPAWWWIGFTLSGLGLLVLIIGMVTLFVAGIGIWGVNIPVAWGLAIAEYVWWIGIASGGTIISALFFLVRAEWRNAVNRLAETMTLFAAAAAGIMPILHLGRQGLFYWLFPYPTVEGILPQFRSPLLWDFFAVICYITASILFWYLGLIPDWATMRDRATRRGTRAFYGVLAMGWRGSARQWRHFRTAYLILAGFMAPMVISVHSIVGLDFAGGLTPGWHSTQFPPYFVFGAVFSGFAAVLILALPIRRLNHLQSVITDRHVDILARLMLTASLLLGYAYLMEVFDAYYRGSAYDLAVTGNRFHGIYAPAYWGTVVFNVLLPQLLWFPAFRRNHVLLFLLCWGVIYGMWLERYVIVTTSLYRDFLPSAWFVYSATFWDWTILAGSGGLFFFGIFVALRLVPIVSIFETAEMMHGHKGEDPAGAEPGHHGNAGTAP